jgi:hypothetical protein
VVGSAGRTNAGLPHLPRQLGRLAAAAGMNLLTLETAVPAAIGSDSHLFDIAETACSWRRVFPFIQ